MLSDIFSDIYTDLFAFCRPIPEKKSLKGSQNRFLEKDKSALV
jgi:hypothetical protein